MVCVEPVLGVITLKEPEAPVVEDKISYDVTVVAVAVAGKTHDKVT